MGLDEDDDAKGGCSYTSAGKRMAAGSKKVVLCDAPRPSVIWAGLK